MSITICYFPDCVPRPVPQGDVSPGCDRDPSLAYTCHKWTTKSPKKSIKKKRNEKKKKKRAKALGKGRSSSQELEEERCRGPTLLV